MNNRNKNIWRFLTFDMWLDALKLLDAHVQAQDKNKHFKTLSMIYYKKLTTLAEELKLESFFENYVKNNFFYGMEKAFSIYPYVTPKAGLGLRNYKFFTYPMRAVYDAVGIYILHLSNEFITNYYRKNKHIKSFYGGGIYLEKEELVITKNNIYFASYYRQFRNTVRKEIKGDISKKVIIRIDIQNYYDEISIPILLSQFERNYKDSEKAKLNFDTTTKEQIEFFFHFLSKGRRGIPQSDNNMISSIIGYLYLVFGDLAIEEELNKDSHLLDDYKIIRYVDDTFISLTFSDQVNETKQKEYVESIGARISDLLFYKLGLRLNPKTRFFWLSLPDDLSKLEKTLKKVSPQYYSGNDEVDDETLENKISNIFHELENLKNSIVEPETFKHELSDEILKEIFDKRVIQILDKKENKERMNEIFKDFDFNRVKEYPLPIIILILKNKESADNFREYLLNKKYTTSKDVDLMLTYLCQTDFIDIPILEFLMLYSPMQDIISNVLETSSVSPSLGYYELNASQIEKISSMPDVIEQIRYRVYSEKLGSCSVALNHLLNELHGICYLIDVNKDDNKKYDADEVINFLQSQGVSHEICIGVRRLFDRRNTNQVSHPGSAIFLAWSVTSFEYNEYRTIVAQCLKTLM